MFDLNESLSKPDWKSKREQLKKNMSFETDSFNIFDPEYSTEIEDDECTEFGLRIKEDLNSNSILEVSQKEGLEDQVEYSSINATDSI